MKKLHFMTIFCVVVGVSVIFTFFLLFPEKSFSREATQGDSEISFTMDTHKIWIQEQRKRKELMGDVCDQSPEKSMNYELLVASKDRRKELFRKLIVDDKSKVLFCLIAKVASTNWRMTLKALRRLNYGELHKSFFRLLNFNPKDALLRLKTYQKVIIVRHPFERLLSAFRNKFEDPSHKQTYVELFGEEMVPNYEIGNSVNFTHFINYLIKNSDSLFRDPLMRTCHWAHYHELCEPCLIHYDFILHYETLMSDSEHILYQIDAPPSLKFPNQTASNTSSLFQKYFKLLDKKQLSDLYLAFKEDFDLFGYSPNIMF